MRALRGFRNGAYGLHWLADDHWTECGRKVKHFDPREELDLATLLPHPEACDVCDALGAGKRRPAPSLATVYLSPGRGRVFKEGPLNPNPSKRRRGGQWIS